jgi:hypothetical protein
MLRNVPLVTLTKDLNLIHLLEISLVEVEILVAVVTEAAATLGKAILTVMVRTKIQIRRSYLMAIMI